MLGLSATKNPFATGKNSSSLKLTAAPGVEDHIAAVLDLFTSNDPYNIVLHDKHINIHGITETFYQNEIDRVERGRIHAPKKIQSENSNLQSETLEKTEKNNVVKKKPGKKI
jgi:hypothetical protein